MAFLRVPHGASFSLRGCPGRLGSECLDLFARPFMMAQRYFDLRDPVNQPATIGLYEQVPPPATPQLNRVSADRTYITWTAKSNLAPMRDQGKSCLKIYFIFRDCSIITELPFILLFVFHRFCSNVACL